VAYLIKKTGGKIAMKPPVKKPSQRMKWL